MPYTRIRLWYGYAPGARAELLSAHLVPHPGGHVCLVVTDEVGKGRDAAHLRDTDESLMHRGHDLWLATLKWVSEGKVITRSRRDSGSLCVAGIVKNAVDEVSGRRFRAVATCMRASRPTGPLAPRSRPMRPFAGAQCGRRREAWRRASAAGPTFSPV